MNVFGSAMVFRRQHGFIAFAIAGAVLLMNPGCRIPQLRGYLPGHTTPDTFKETVDGPSSAQMGIEEFFNDAVLTNLIHEGLHGNQELKILAEDIQIANNEVQARRGAYLPFIGLGGRAGLEKPSLYTPLGAVEENLDFSPGKGFPDPLPNFMAAANFSWEVDIWKQLRNARDAATFRYLATAEGRNYVVTRLVAEIAENYYTLMALDQRLEVLDRTIALQERSLEIAKASKEGARGTELPVQRFEAEVRKNQSEKLMIKQEIVEAENRINFLLGRYPQPVERPSAHFFDLDLHALRLGLPSDLLLNRPDIRQAERELQAAGLDVNVARANFYPKLTITAGVGFEGFNPRYLVMSPESLIYSAVGELTAPLINRAAIKAEYQSANARQLQACYRYQQVVLSAFTEVVNQISAVENYTKSIAIKQEQLAALETSVDVAGKLFNATRIEYFDVLFAQRDLMDARLVLIETKLQQLVAAVGTYQALGGGLVQTEYVQAAFVTLEEQSSPTAPVEPVPELVPPAPTTDPSPTGLSLPPTDDENGPVIQLQDGAAQDAAEKKPDSVKETPPAFEEEKS